MSNYTDVLENLEHLKLDKIRSMLPEYLENVTKDNSEAKETLLAAVEELKKLNKK